jgi:transposase
MRAISTDRRNSIFSLINQGKSIAQIASQLGLSTSTVFKYKNSLAPLVGRVVGGRVAKLSDSKKRLIKRKVLDGKLTTAVQVHHELEKEGYELSYTTVCNTLHALGFEAKTKKKSLSYQRDIVKPATTGRKSTNIGPLMIGGESFGQTKPKLTFGVRMVSSIVGFGPVTH